MAKPMTMKQAQKKVQEMMQAQQTPVAPKDAVRGDTNLNSAAYNGGSGGYATANKVSWTGGTKNGK